MGMQLEVNTDDLTVIISTDIPNYDPMVLSDMINQLPDLMGKAEAFILSREFEDDDDDDDAS